uniref:Neuromast-expressed gpi-anchored lymphocyte antigen 6 n=1 Tax=Sinocyclocheilus rhinocerous TaxID=307959 RepID=A0A673GR09_9TELE
MSNSAVGNNTLADMTMKNCSETHQCVTASANFGITKIVINNQCCNTNLIFCNFNYEDHCIKVTGKIRQKSDGQMMTMKGCVTRSFCMGDLSTKIGQSSIAAEQSCCKGHLCNSAQTATPSRFFQLGILMYAILQTSF